MVNLPKPHLPDHHGAGDEEAVIPRGRGIERGPVAQASGGAAVQVDGLRDLQVGRGQEARKLGQGRGGDIGNEEDAPLAVHGGRGAGRSVAVIQAGRRLAAAHQHGPAL